MWILEGFPENPDPITNEYGAGLVVNDYGSDYGYAPLTLIDYGSEYQAPDIVSDRDIVIIETPIPDNTPGDPIVFDLSDQEIGNITLVQSGSATYTPALNPSDPQPGEFTWDPDSRELTLHPELGDPLTPGLSVQVYGAIAVVPTKVISPQLIEALYGLPVTGKLTYRLSAENHPSGSLTLYTLGDGIIALRSRLKQGTELIIGSIGFSVGEPSEDLRNTEIYPQGYYEYSVPLTGKWARSKYNELSFFDPAAAKKPAATDEAFSDPNCTLGVGNDPTEVSTGVSVSSLARQVGGSFSAGTYGGGGAYQATTGDPDDMDEATAIATDFSNTLNEGNQYVSISGGGTVGRWEVEVPENAPGNAGQRWIDAAKSLCRKNGCFLDFNDPLAVRAISIYNTPSWSYTVPVIKISYAGDTERSPDHHGYAFEFKNAKLEGDIEEITGEDPEEDTQGNVEDLKPRWQPRTPKREFIPTGEKDPPPPEDSRILSTLSLNWDVSGDTKEYTEMEAIDGQPYIIRHWLYGWKYTADEIAIAGKLEGNPGAHWGEVEYRESVYEYDLYWRVLVKVETTGWSWRRFKQESDQSQETVNESDEGRRRPYRFKQVSIHEVKQFSYRSFFDFYKDFAQAEEPKWHYYTVPTPLGTCEIRRVQDPNWRPALFMDEEYHYLNCYDSMPDPDSSEASPLPDLITGQEMLYHRKVTILASANTRTITNINDRELDDRYVEEVREHSPQGPGFGEDSARNSREVRSGKPSKADTLPPLYELVNPTEEENEESEEDDLYEYRIGTPGWDLSDVRDTYSDDAAQDIGELIRSAKTTLKIEDILNSVNYEYEIPHNGRIRPFDHVTVTARGETHQNAVTDVAQEIDISTLDGVPLLSALNTKISAGIDRTIPLRQRKLKVPDSSTDDGSGDIFNDVRVGGIQVGEIFPLLRRSRRNPRGGL